MQNAIRWPQNIDASTYTLSVTGLVQAPRNCTYDQVINGHQSYMKVVTISCVEGWDATILWQGVLVVDLINEAFPKQGAQIAIFHASDGYTTSLPLDYLDSDKILLAYKMNNATIPRDTGFPFMLVAQDKWGYKWIKWVTQIEVSGDTSYRGYWESRGYTNSGDLDKNFLED